MPPSVRYLWRMHTNDTQDAPADVAQNVGQLADALESALRIATGLMESGRVPRSCGRCGTPSASCDGDCVDAAYISRDLYRAQRVLDRVRS